MITRIPKVPKGQRAQIPGRVKLEHPDPNFCRQQVQKDISLNLHRVAQRAFARAAAEHGAPHSGLPQLAEISVERCTHALDLNALNLNSLDPYESLRANFLGAIDHQLALIVQPHFEPG